MRILCRILLGNEVAVEFCTLRDFAVGDVWTMPLRFEPSLFGYTVDWRIEFEAIEAPT